MKSAQQKPPARAIMLAGATASGKSELALHLAQAFNGALINADSMQVYSELAILTARPSPADTRLAPHHLYGHHSARHAYNVGLWVAEATRLAEQCWQDNRLPIFVGGTGLYFHALLNGLAAIPDIPSDIRDTLRAQMERDGASALHTALAEFDSISHSKLKPSDAQRILRAHEVYRATGRALSAWQAEPVTPPLGEPVLKLLLMPSRDWLYERCDQRFAAMLTAGALDEVAALRSLNLPPDAPARKALGVQELTAHLDGLKSLEEASLLAQQNTRRYAKRQMTWFRNQMISWISLNEQDYFNNMPKIFSIIAENT